MKISRKIKKLLFLSGGNYTGLALALGIRKRDLHDMFFRNSFTPADLLIISEYVGFPFIGGEIRKASKRR